MLKANKIKKYFTVKLASKHVPKKTKKHPKEDEDEDPASKAAVLL